MIRVRKPAAFPPRLTTHGVPLRDALLIRAQRGEFDFEFDSDVYGHESVKTVLVAAQHGKCAFCESKFTHIAYGDVEHFRPKAAVRVAGRLSKPGYFWLAYEWSNLYASCQICNQRYKRNAFPIVGRRATYEAPDVLAERGLLLNPGKGDPERHIEFIGSVPHGRTRRGRETIYVLGLRREALNGERRDRAMQVDRHLRGVTLLIDHEDAELRDHASDLIADLCKWMRDDAEYAAMSRCLIRAHPLAARILAAC